MNDIFGTFGMLICDLLLALDRARLTFLLLFPHMCARAACIDVMPVKKETSTWKRVRPYLFLCKTQYITILEREVLSGSVIDTFNVLI